MFKEQTSCNLEVYVEDLLVKSKELKGYINDVRRAFVVFRKYKMELNLTKSTFKLGLGKFLRFMVLKRGIEANPEKIHVMINMKSPQTINKV